MVKWWKKNKIHDKNKVKKKQKLRMRLKKEDDKKKQLTDWKRKRESQKEIDFLVFCPSRVNPQQVKTGDWWRSIFWSFA